MSRCTKCSSIGCVNRQVCNTNKDCIQVTVNYLHPEFSTLKMQLIKRIRKTESVDVDDLLQELDRQKRVKEKEVNMLYNKIDGVDFTPIEPDESPLIDRSMKKCYYCEMPYNTINQISKDHIIPISKGGSNSKFNIVSSCRKCNSFKSSLTLEELLVSGVQKQGMKAHKIEMLIQWLSVPENKNKCYKTHKKVGSPKKAKSKIATTKLQISKIAYSRMSFAYDKGLQYYKAMKSSIDGGNLFMCKATRKFLQAQRIYYHYLNYLQRQDGLHLSDTFVYNGHKRVKSKMKIKDTYFTLPSETINDFHTEN